MVEGTGNLSLSPVVVKGTNDPGAGVIGKSTLPGFQQRATVGTPANHGDQQMPGFGGSGKEPPPTASGGVSGPWQTGVWGRSTWGKATWGKAKEPDKQVPTDSATQARRVAATPATDAREGAKDTDGPSVKPTAENAIRVTIKVGEAWDAVSLSHEAFKTLLLVNDLPQAQRDLLDQITLGLADIRAELQVVRDERDVLIAEKEALRKLVEKNSSLWRRAKEEFVIKAASAAGEEVGKSVGAGAAYIAGLLTRDLFAVFFS